VTTPPPEYLQNGHRWQWRAGRGRPLHRANCPCWREDVDTVAAIRGRWTKPSAREQRAARVASRRRRWWSSW
jgi:hypothetical protein